MGGQRRSLAMPARQGTIRTGFVFLDCAKGCALLLPFQLWRCSITKHMLLM